MHVRRRKVRWHRGLTDWLVINLAPLILAMIGSTWRVRIIGLKHLQAARQRGRPIVIAGLHGRLVPLIYRLARPPLGPGMIMSSPSKDGYVSGNISRKLGMLVITGSTGVDGARGFRTMLRQLRDNPGRPACMLVDGSRGPRGHCKPGAIALARVGGEVVLPVIATSDRHLQGTSWDRWRLPALMSRVTIAVLPPITVPRKASAEEQERLRQLLEHQLVRGTEVLDVLAHGVDSSPVREEAKHG